MSKFSKREKILLSLLLILAIVAVAVMLVIQPLKEMGQQIQNDYYRYEEQQINMQAVLDSQADIRKANEEKTAEAEAVQANYPGRLKSYEIHNMLADICADYSVKMEDLVIKDYAEVTDITKKPVSTGTYGLYACDVSLQLLGTTNALLNFENACCDYKDYMQVNAFVLGDMVSGEAPLKQATLQLRLYAIEGATAAGTTAPAN
jgi:hypothetical protein